MTPSIKTLIIVFCILNFIAYLIMHIDKKNARAGRKRISEASLLTIAAIGGSLGILVCMYAIRHKTRKKRFTIGVPIIMLLQIVAICLLLA